MSARKTRRFVPIARNFDTSGSLDNESAVNAQVFFEDQVIVERQRPEDLPLDMRAKAHFATDRTSAGYCRLLREMGLEGPSVVG